MIKKSISNWVSVSFMSILRILIVILFLPILFSACSKINLDDKNVGVCNELKSQLIFNGNTASTRNAEIENAQEPLIQRTYDKRCDS